MHNILFIKSSLSGEQGQSTILSQSLVEQFKSNASVNVVERDLAKEPLPHLTQAELGAWSTEPEQRTDEQNALASTSDILIEELKNSDTIVIAMPMYNFGVPSTFKAWVDRIARAGVTFRYTENGPVGLLENKKLFVVATRGGLYEGTAKDSQTQYLNDVFALIGIKDINFVYAEGLNMAGSDIRLASAKQALETVSL
ncbi:FMN-dependent NADH-azoreductase [Alteromonas sp. 345S023]|uniref:FMN dependent NADH:quinone oxidoreductase n=1 Tax=Alteromonas profundi TaxID=2696062 RepID=A0A7X5LPQ8_9ALTE|nr:NAD(P)H-dependent oxidoreductase [Alteromonas profundi]NDV93208.1 FMN-dependent NADH-azoreductase [Alteromonas profundi]